MSVIKEPVMLDRTGRELISVGKSIAAALWAEKTPVIPSKDVNLYDYDGTIVYSYTRAEFLGLAALPANPAHEGLTAQGWNWTLAAAQEYVGKYTYLDIGQSYITDDGKTRLYIDISETEKLGVTVNWTQTLSEGVTLDWGDGSATETDEASTGFISKSHTYSQAGRYIITLDPADGCTLGLGSGTAMTTGVLSSITFGGKAPLVALEIGRGVTKIARYSLKFFDNLETITIPVGVTTIGDYTMEGCGSLKAAILPAGMTTAGNYTFRCDYNLHVCVLPEGLTNIGTASFPTCVALERLSIPEGVTTISANSFRRCFRAKRIVVPDSVQSFGADSFGACYALKGVRIPEGVTVLPARVFKSCQSLSDVSLPSTLQTIAMQAFSGCFAIAGFTIPASVTRIEEFAFLFCDGNQVMHILATTPPVLVSATAFSEAGPGYAIYVPWSEGHSVLAAYQQATNWCGLQTLQEEPAPEGGED